MSFDFSADEIFEMAEQIERNGAQFYRSSADGVKDPSSRELLMNLAAMEDEHEKTFASMRSDLSVEEKSSPTFDPDNEAVLYLKALADSRVFVEKQVPKPDTMTDRSDADIIQEILKFAIGAEKESIVFYLGMKDTVPENLGKGRLDAIIKEEMGHIRMLSNRLVSMNP
jgi:rubrerythrin